MSSLDLEAIRSEVRPGGIPWSFRLYDSVDSTMDVARALSGGYAPAGTVVVADEQTAGRGRMGRSWQSPPGENLYFTLLLYPPIPVLRRLAMITPLAVAEGIESQVCARAEIKWPNDIQLGGLKCGGVLIDSEVRGNDAMLTLIGIGIDVNQEMNESHELLGIATSVRTHTGAPCSREALLASVLNRFDHWYSEVSRGSDVRLAWRDRLNTIGRSVQVTGPLLAESGVVEDVDQEGSLVLRRSDGTRLTIPAGEVTLRPPSVPD